MSLESGCAVAELPFYTRAQLRAQQERLQIPAMYDALTWYERSLVREEYIILQKGACYWCKETLLHDTSEELKASYPLDPRYWPEEFLKHPVHLHHCHRSGLTLGATHAYCNAILAMYYGE